MLLQKRTQGSDQKKSWRAVHDWHFPDQLDDLRALKALNEGQTDNNCMRNVYNYLQYMY